MRFSFFSLFHESPFQKLKNHADKVKECAWMFKRAAECYVQQDCEEFDQLTEEVAKLESQADWLKRNLRNHLPRGLAGCKHVVQPSVPQPRFARMGHPADPEGLRRPA